MPFGTNFMPGEDDWLRRLMGAGPLGAPSGAGVMGTPAPAITTPMQSSTVGGGLFGKLASKLNEGVNKIQSNPTSQLGLRILANSGPSPQRRGLGEILGTSFLQQQQAGQQTQEDALKQRFMEAQIEAMKRPQARKPVAVLGPDGKPVYADESDAIGKTPYAEPDKPAAGIQEYEYAVKNGFKGSILDWVRQKGDAGRQDPSNRYINTARGLFQIGPNGQPVLVPGTDPQGVSGRPIPQGMANDFQSNANALNLIDQILPSFDPNAGDAAAKAAVGPRNAVIDAVLPDSIADNVKNWWDPKGTDTRTFLSNLNSTVIKDRSGAAVTVSEFARQRGFLPSDKDSPAVVQKKLNNLRKAVADNQQYLSDFADSQGYRPPPTSIKPPGQRGASGNWGDPEVDSLIDKYAPKK